MLEADSNGGIGIGLEIRHVPGDLHRPGRLPLLEEGFEPISFEKKVDPGFIDVYGMDKNGKLVVVEIKRKSADKQAVIQLSKYVKSIKSRVNREVRGILVAPDLARGVQTFLETSSLEFKPLDPKQCESVLRRTRDMKLDTFFPAGDEH